MHECVERKTGALCQVSGVLSGDIFTIGPGNCVHIRRCSHLRAVHSERFLCMFPFAS